MNRAIKMLSSLLLAGSSLNVNAVPLSDTSLNIDNYRLTNIQRISRFEYEYTYSADAINTGAALGNVTATLGSNSNAMTVTEGSLSFGNIADNTTQSSNDTFSVRHNRRVGTFDTSAFLWDVSISPNLDPTAFILKIKTDNITVSPFNPNPPSDSEFTIPVSGGIFLNYDYTVDCDSDGISEASNVTDSYTCQYNAPGIYTVSITGTFPKIVFNRSTEAKKLISIEQWGSQEWDDMELSFAGCINMIYNATDKPNLSRVTRLNAMFWGAEVFNGNIDNWDVSNVQDMTLLFAGAKLFNQTISSWNVSRVRSMEFMFSGATDFDKDLGNWDTGNVTNMKDMFEGAINFNQNISQWNTGNVTTMFRMFQDAASFNQDISQWDVSKVTNMAYMFARQFKSSPFNQSLTTWDVSSVTDMQGMFRLSNFNSAIDNWDVSSVTDMSRMFEQNFSFNQGISSWNVSAVTSMERMFTRAVNFTDHDLSTWDVRNVALHDFFLAGAGSGNIAPQWP
ncbi:MAG: BspA family leucine-rich repeat surface protein [Gammaproteobacteria bacterium]